MGKEVSSLVKKAEIVILYRNYINNKQTFLKEKSNKGGDARGIEFSVNSG